MTAALKLHPASRCAAVTLIDVEARRQGARLRLRYRMAGVMDDVRLPPLAAPEFADGLWRATCLEAFVQSRGQRGYVELNFAPSSRWAAYRFEGHRQGMAPAAELGPPQIEVRRSRDGFELEAVVDLGRAPELGAEAPWRLGLSAVIQEAHGRISFWALEHPAGKPDFHHADCFALELPAPERS